MLKIIYRESSATPVKNQEQEQNAELFAKSVKNPS